LALGYIRTSKRTQGQSVRDQKRDGRELHARLQADLKQAGRPGLTPIKFLIATGESGADLHRPSLRRLFGQVLPCQRSVVLVRSVDRLVRNPLVAANIWAQIVGRKVFLVSYSEAGVNTLFDQDLDLFKDPVDEALYHYMARVNEAYREYLTIRQRTMKGQATARSEGRKPGRKPISTKVLQRAIEHVLAGDSVRVAAKAEGISKSLLYARIRAECPETLQARR
jgi:DNA invertase Pin-like site-specific DNA recombinase